ncbi:MAG: hypothetical protein QOH31_5072 [Verrucomicrobiota bacterium]|jgi:hypothetical protein
MILVLGRRGYCPKDRRQHVLFSSLTEKGVLAMNPALEVKTEHYGRRVVGHDLNNLFHGVPLRAAIVGRGEPVETRATGMGIVDRKLDQVSLDARFISSRLQRSGPGLRRYIR